MVKFSVVIPLYNKENHIAGTLRSALRQSYPHFEIIVINDGSTDQSLLIAQRFKDERVKIIDQENYGLSRARNVSIGHSKYEYIALLDADDLWEKDHLETLNLLIAKFPEADLFGTGYEETFKNGNKTPPKINIDPNASPQLIVDFFEANLNQPLIAPSSFAFNKNIIEKIGEFDTAITYSEDVDFYIRANLNYRFAYHPKITCKYTFEGENQIVHSKKSQRSIPDFQKYLDHYPNHKSLKKFINLKRYFLCVFYKIESENELFKKMRTKVDVQLLNSKQRLLIDSNRNVIIGLRWIKAELLRRGMRVTTF